MNIVERRVRDEGTGIGQVYRIGDRVTVTGYKVFPENEAGRVREDIGDLGRIMVVDAPLQILTGAEASEFRRQVEAGQTPQRVPKTWRYAWTQIGTSLVFATEQPFLGEESNYRLPEELCTALAFSNVKRGDLQAAASTVHWNVTETRIQLFVYRKDSLVGFDSESYRRQTGPADAIAALLERAKIDAKTLQRMFLTGISSVILGYDDWLLETFKKMTGTFVNCDFVSFGNHLRDEQQNPREDIPISFFGAGWAASTGIGPDFMGNLIPVEPPKERTFSGEKVKMLVETARQSVQPVAAGLLIGLLVGGGFFFRNSSLEAKRGETLAAQMAEEEKKEKENANIQKEITDIEARLAVMKKIKTAIETETPKQKSLSNLLKLLQSRYIPGLVLTEFSAEGSALTFSGYIADTSVYGREGGGPIDGGNLLGQFIRQLEQSGECSNIVPEIRNENEKLAFFKVSCTFKGITGKEPLELPATSKLLDDARAAAGAPPTLTAQGKDRK
jgi:hypothetical protein